MTDRPAAIPPALNMISVSKTYRTSGAVTAALRGSHRDVHAVTDVSLTIGDKEVVGVIGQSGSGKTTLGRMAVGLLKPSTGTVEVAGVDISNVSGRSLRAARRNFQIVFQDPYQSLNPALTVYRLLEEPLMAHHLAGSKRERRETVFETLAAVGLEPVRSYAERMPRGLSGGQRQRVAIGRAVIVRPKFLVADEAVSMLDVSVRAGVLRLLTSLRDMMGMAELFISHDLAVAKQVCDRLVIMRAGEIVESGPAVDLLANPATDYTRRLLAALPRVRPSES